MKKRKIGRTLSRSKDQKVALLRTLLVSLTKYGRVKTTLAKAKELRPFAERMITRAKRGVKADRRMIVLRMLKKDVTLETAKKLIELAKVFEGRNGGYVRIVKLPFRKSDGADMALIEWTQKLEKEEKTGVDKKEEKKETSEKKFGKEAEEKKEVKTDKKSE